MAPTRPGLPPRTRLTRQRRAVLGALDGVEGAFTPAELLARGRRAEPSLGLATVYRTLDLLRGEGAVRALTVAGRAAWVRCRPDHHHHLVCVRCGAVEETELCGLPGPEELRRRHGFVAEAHDLEVYGTCRRCAA